MIYLWSLSFDPRQNFFISLLIQVAAILSWSELMVSLGEYFRFLDLNLLLLSCEFFLIGYRYWFISS